MSKMGTLNMRIDVEVKQKADELFKELGITTTDAINLFLRQAIFRNGLPFDVTVPEPNEATKRAVYELENNINTKTFDNADDMFKELGI